MRKTYLTIALALILGVASGAFAQTVDAARASVPFSFEVQGQKFPAGTYVITPYSGDSRLVMIENTEIRTTRALLPTSATANGSTTKLVFDVSGDTHVLRAIEKAAH